MASYDIRSGNGEGLFLFLIVILTLHSFVTYLLVHLPTYLQPWGTHVAITTLTTLLLQHHPATLIRIIRQYHRARLQAISLTYRYLRVSCARQSHISELVPAVTANVLQTKVDAQCDKLATELS